LKKVRIAAAAGTVVALAVSGTVAVAQPPPPSPFTAVSGSVTPKAGGSKKKPRNAKVGFNFALEPTQKKTLSKIHYYLPKNIVVSGKGFKFCTAAKINAKGAGSCPAASKVGTGRADVALGPLPSPIGFFEVSVFAAAKNKLALSLSGPVEGIPAFTANIVKSKNRAYGQQIDITVPPEAQKNAGLFVYTTGINNLLGGKSATIRKNGKKKKVYFVSTTGCPKSGTHAAAVSVDYLANDAGPAGSTQLATSSSPCK